VTEFGFNFRFDDIRAALGLAQLAKTRKHQQSKERINQTLQSVAFRVRTRPDTAVRIDTRIRRAVAPSVSRAFPSTGERIPWSRYPGRRHSDQHSLPAHSSFLGI
jgi:hypothetical protein